MTFLSVLAGSLIVVLQLNLVKGLSLKEDRETLVIYNSPTGRRAVHLSNDPQDPCHIYGNRSVSFNQFFMLLSDIICLGVCNRYVFTIFISRILYRILIVFNAT